jgi:uncharacterized protein (TIGR02266 family)
MQSMSAPESQKAASENAATADQRREYQRHRIEIEIDVSSDHNFYAGITSDLSEGGVFVATHLERSVGTLVDLAFRLPGTDQPLQAVGEVRWLRSYSESSDVPPGLGIRFVLLGPGAREAIQRFLAQRDPMFYDT